jgi:hypothetical protein
MSDSPATGINRATVKAELLRQLRLVDGMADVGIFPGWPGDELPDEHVYVARTDGLLNEPTSKSGRLKVDDMFSFYFVLGAMTDGNSITEAEARVQDYMTALTTVVARDGQLGGSIDGLLAVMLEDDDVEGPNSAASEQGWYASAAMAVSCHTRIN